MIAICKHCGHEIEREDGVWVDTLSGDEGGTYDICPDGRPRYENDVEPRHEPVDPAEEPVVSAVHDFTHPDSLPTHYRDNGDLCPESGKMPRDNGSCPNGCDFAPHYANDGHEACVEEPCCYGWLTSGKQFHEYGCPKGNPI